MAVQLGFDDVWYCSEELAAMNSDRTPEGIAEARRRISRGNAEERRRGGGGRPGPAILPQEPDR